MGGFLEDSFPLADAMFVEGRVAFLTRSHTLFCRLPLLVHPGADWVTAGRCSKNPRNYLSCSEYAHLRVHVHLRRTLPREPARVRAQFLLGACREWLRVLCMYASMGLHTCKSARSSLCPSSPVCSWANACSRAYAYARVRKFSIYPPTQPQLEP